MRKTKLDAMKDLAGVKNKRLILKRPGEKISDGQGGYKGGDPEPVEVAPVWGELRKPRPSVTTEAGAIVGKATLEFKIWKRPDVERGWFVGYNGKDLPIENTYSYDAENLILVCREVII